MASLSLMQFRVGPTCVRACLSRWQRGTLFGVVTIRFTGRRSKSQPLATDLIRRSRATDGFERRIRSWRGRLRPGTSPPLVPSPPFHLLASGPPHDLILHRFRFAVVKRKSLLLSTSILKFCCLALGVTSRNPKRGDVQVMVVDHAINGLPSGFLPLSIVPVQI